MHRRTGDEHLARATLLRAIDLGSQSIDVGGLSVDFGAQAIVDRYLSTRPRTVKVWERYTKAQEEMNHSQSVEHLFASAYTERQLNG